LYDSHLAHADLTTTQFSLLRAIEKHDEPVPLARLAEEQVFERTSLYRALEPLSRDGLVKLTAEPGRRAKDVELTARGRQRIARALPYWQKAQGEFVKQFGSSAWETLSTQLIAIVQVAHELADR
jgi:DNA-binding MarR family transcriptional regulator